MTVFFVDFVNGLDANNGLGPDASHASNKPWKTIAKLLGVSGMASGDTAYLSPAGPFREILSVQMTSPTAETKIIGDPANAQGFKTSGGVLVEPGDVVWTPYLTDDTTAPSATAPVSINGKSFFTFENILFVGGTDTNRNIINAVSPNSTNITFRDCAFIGNKTNTVAMSYVGSADIASNWVVDRCFFNSMCASAIRVSLPTSAVADYDTNFQVTNCSFIGSFTAGVEVITTGAGAFKGGGVDIFNCSFQGGGPALYANSANLSTSIPCTIYNSVIVAGVGIGIRANTSGQVLEDNNYIAASTPRTNVTAGGASISNHSHALMIEFGQAYVMGRSTHRPYFSPTKGSPQLGRGATAGGPAVDILNRARPSGGESTSYAWGAYERHDTWIRETTTVRTGSNALSCLGPGDGDFHVPVDAASTTVTVYMRYDTNHAATNKPQMKVLNGEEIGVAEATATMTAAVDTWEQLSLNFTPTAKGIVTIRLISRSAAGNGKAFADDFSY